ncbi:MAG: YfcE family phosphodiesterase [Candidatus Helarchaeota archaeon]|nr:YfcE family phosphodiesterase [Candidatus Helarchaeota archaeon]
MILLLIGDFHIPTREKKIPFEIWQETQNSKFDLIVCTGDLTDPELLSKLQFLAPVKIVMGNMDYYHGLRKFPRSLVINLKKCKVGLIHGSGIHPRGNPEQLSKIANEMQVEILISGHTHAQSVRQYNEILLLNPGSATGSWGGGPSTGIPSFQILEEINDEVNIVSVYLKSGRLSRLINLYNIETRKLR